MSLVLVMAQVACFMAVPFTGYNMRNTVLLLLCSTAYGLLAFNSFLI